MTGRAPIPGCTGGFGVEKLMRTGMACATCGYPAIGPGGVEHCYLYERCERCGSDTDPCAVAVAIRAEMQRKVGA